jgi:glycosyltransferase involved in cell wall biosynthesis
MGWEQFAVSGENTIVPREDEASFAVATQPAEREYAVIYKGPYEDEFDGVCSAVRRHANALLEAGVPTVLQSRTHTMTVGGVRSHATFADLTPAVQQEIDRVTRTSFSKTLLVVHHVVPTLDILLNIAYPVHMAQVDENAVEAYRKASFLMLAFEGDRVTSQVAKVLNLFGEIWVPCEQNRQMLKHSGVTAEIVVIPHPYKPGDSMVTVEPSKRSPTNPLKLLSVGKWEPRKDQHTMIGAFLMAFSPKDAPRLIIKTSDFGAWQDYSAGATESVLQWMSHPVIGAKWTAEQAGNHVFTIRERMPREQLARMYAECVVYVSPGRAEGFDLPAFDAKLVGLPMVHVGYGGTADFADPETDLQVHDADTPMVPVHKQYSTLAGAQWSGYTPEAMAAAMRRAVAHALAGATKRRDVRALERFSVASVGRLMRQRLEARARALGVEVPW